MVSSAPAPDPPPPVFGLYMNLTFFLSKLNSVPPNEPTSLVRDPKEIFAAFKAFSRASLVLDLSLFSTLIKYVPSVSNVNCAAIDVALVYVTESALVIKPDELIASTVGTETKLVPVIVIDV